MFKYIVYFTERKNKETDIIKEMFWCIGNYIEIFAYKF